MTMTDFGNSYMTWIVDPDLTDKRAIHTYNDAEAGRHEAVHIQQHLAAQDAFLQRLIDELCERKSQMEAGLAEKPG